MDGTIIWQRIEAGVLFALGVGLMLQAGSVFPLWLAVVLFFAPDLSFAGYLGGPRVGAFCYNLVHQYALGAGLLLLGYWLALPLLVALGGLWLAHSGFDRLLGYGLKSTRGFTDTHLGRIGRRGDA
jgi:hypothetical protein